ncbi:VOC family protein [Actinomadura sp. ATCC 31491]|uniref:VOC family protein n=1 Tax=Actinomadura luzonensis TaxID=2805427 RepID=A0ABT0FX05_9ACTN|nr:VOC family protein [Actinomadura luzonensis]MCK2216881.1 VOC family protein [Actinomadura luzonensis]
MLTLPHLPGAPCWLDVSSPDVDASDAFYGGLFGWRSVSLGPGHRDYRLCRIGGRTAAGISHATPDGPAASWLTYFLVADAEAAAKTVEQAGGAVAVPPRDIEGQGRMAVCADPAGARFAVWQPGRNEGVGLVAEPGSLSRVELRTSDPGGARSFYRAVFGWSVRDEPVGGTSRPVLFPAGGGAASAMGGIAALDGDDAGGGSDNGDGGEPYWLPYFEVRACDASAALAQQLGGTLRAAAGQGAGRTAFLADPFGARFAITTGSG